MIKPLNDSMPSTKLLADRPRASPRRVARVDIARPIKITRAMSKKANDSPANARPKTTATRTANVVLVTPVPKTPWKQ